MSACTTRRESRRGAFSWLILLATLAFSAGAAERGLPLITVFPAEVHRAGPQTFDITQDPRGILYFGNLHGLLTYDGAWWRLRKLPDEQVALALATNRDGVVAIGMVNDFGYLAHGANGEREYRSLLPQLPANKRNLGDIRAVCSHADGFLYVAERTLLFWDGKTTKIAGEFTNDDAPRGCLNESGTLYVRSGTGLHRFDTKALRLIPSVLDGRVLVAIGRGDGSLVAGVRDVGLFTIKDNVATPFAPEASGWLKGKLISGGTRLRDGRLVITTRQDGVLILHPSGLIEEILGTDAGLPDALVNEPYVDREGSLWLAMEGPLVRIDLGSPVTVFDARRGLRGGAGDVTRHAGRIYAAMTHGLYEIDPQGNARRLDGMEEGAWRVIAIDDELLVGSVKGFYRVDRNGRMEHVIENEGEVYDFSRSPSDPTRVWVAQGDGVSSVRRVNGKWQFEGLLPGVAQDVSTVLEHDGVLWVGTVFNGILRIDRPRTPQQRVTQYGSGEMNVYRVGGRVAFVRATGEIVSIDDNGRFVPDPKLGHIRTPRGFFVIAEDPKGGVWINSTPPRVFERGADGTYAKEGKPLVAVTAADIQNLRITNDGVVWFAADKGLFRYEPTTAAAAAAPQPAPLIRRVVAGDNRVILNGDAPKNRVDLRHNFGRIRIEVAPVSYLPGITYQYRLDPIDEEWSDWNSEPFIDYTTLEANDYTFRVRARSSAMIAGNEARWSFRVLPPWYRTTWAYALWALLAIGAVVLVIRVRTGALQRQAEKLRAKVEEKTAELQETVSLL
ncbi:MAG: triple tyrosine motif-containing protein, partial [Thermoanaerobaculia bacterium]